MLQGGVAGGDEDPVKSSREAASTIITGRAGRVTPSSLALGSAAATCLHKLQLPHSAAPVEKAPQLLLILVPERDPPLVLHRLLWVLVWVCWVWGGGGWPLTGQTGAALPRMRPSRSHAPK